jgi:hypothetical protein
MRKTVGQAPRLRTGALAGPPAVGRQGVRVFNGGDVLVIASGRHQDSCFGAIGETCLMRKFDKEARHGIPGYFESGRNVVTVGATGLVGIVHIRDEKKWFLHDGAPELASLIVVRYYLHSRVKHDFCLAFETTVIGIRRIERFNGPCLSIGPVTANPQPVRGRAPLVQRLRIAVELDDRT